MVLLDGCEISFDDDDTNYRKDGGLLFYYRKSENSLRVRYDILLGLELKYDLEHQELCDLLNSIAEDVLDAPPIETGWFV